MSTRKKKVTGKKKVCANTLCSEASECLIPCNDCLLSFHPECCGMNADLYNLLLTTQCSGLTWTWRCCSCSSKFSSEEVKSNDLSNQLNAISQSLQSELRQEIKHEMESIQHSLTRRMDDFEKREIS